MSVKNSLILIASLASSGAVIAGSPDMMGGSTAAAEAPQHTAAPMCDTVSLINGFYAGGGLSFNMSHTSADNLRLGGQGIGFNFYGGYDMLTMGKMYLGLNGFLNFYGISSNDSNIKTKTRYTFGMAVEPGYSVANNLNVFARLGYGGMSVRYQTSTQSQSKVRGALVLGVGSEFGITQNIGIRTTYTYYYAGGRSAVGYNSVKPGLGEFMMGASYHF